MQQLKCFDLCPALMRMLIYETSCTALQCSHDQLSSEHMLQGSLPTGGLVNYMQQAITIYQQATNSCHWNAANSPVAVARTPGPAYT